MICLSSHIVYVNGGYKGNDEVGKLLHDFSCKKSKDMYYPELAKGVRHFKEEEGGRKIMCEAVEKYADRKALSGDYRKQLEEKEVLTLEEQGKLFSFIRESNTYNIYAPVFIILLETGLRCGELIGLTWENVDMQNRELPIDHQLIYKDWGEGYGFRVSTPKTKAGIRAIPFTETVYRTFVDQRKNNFMLVNLYSAVNVKWLDIL